MKTRKLVLASPRIALIAIATAAMTLSGCGGGINGQVAQVCMGALTTQLGAQPFEGDPKQFAKVARVEGEGIYVVESTIVVDKGLTSEVTRGFMCRVQTDPQGKTEPSLILLQVGW
jgi:hypothetical protein